MNMEREKEKIYIMTGFDVKKAVYDRIVYKISSCVIVRTQLKRKEERE